MINFIRKLKRSQRNDLVHQRDALVQTILHHSHTGVGTLALGRIAWAEFLFLVVLRIPSEGC